jgi:hypothetical protein
MQSKSKIIKREYIGCYNRSQFLFLQILQNALVLALLLLSVFLTGSSKKKKGDKIC